MAILGRFTREGKRKRASELDERAHQLKEEGQHAEAAELYRRACSIDPTWAVPFYNLGLLHKYQGEWSASLQANLRATELDASDQAAWWNLGIAATALGRWDMARKAWQGAGIDVPAGDGPIDFPCGQTPVRLDPEGEPEVVWCQRLDPVRARISNIPLGEFCFGDVVLHDGAAVGYRKLEDREHPVFNFLELLEPSSFSTFAASITLGEAGDASIEELCRLADERGLAAEDWTSSAYMLCKACSEGLPHERHEHTRLPRPANEPHNVALAARSQAEAEALLRDWRAQTPGVEVGELEIEFSRS